MAHASGLKDSRTNPQMRKLLSHITLFMGLCLPLALSAQESGTVRGLVVEASGSARVAQANVTNTRTKQVAVSSPSGEFSIEATVGDSLLISKLGFQTVATEIKTLSDILINFHRSSIQIETVTVERLSKEAELEDVMDGYRRQGVYFEGKPKAMQYIANPITSLYELLGRTPKNARRFRNTMEWELGESAVDRIFNQTRVQDITGLEGEDLANFMRWYRPSYDKVANWAEYDIMLYIQNSFKQFDRDGRPPAPTLPKLEAPQLKK